MRDLELVIMTFKQHYEAIGFGWDDTWESKIDHGTYRATLDSVEEENKWDYPLIELEYIVNDTEISKVAMITDKNNEIRFYEVIGGRL